MHAPIVRTLTLIVLATTTVIAEARTSPLENMFETVAKEAFKPSLPQPRTFAAGTTYTTCFTPGQACDDLIVSEIHAAKRSILMQAYSFTHPGIAKALVDAKGRGVDVRAILDKSQRTEKYSGATFLNNAGIPTMIDEKPAIAHSKILILDQQSVLTGSYNFTRSAQERNAENFMVIRGDGALVKTYSDNWLARWNVSIPFRP